MCLKAISLFIMHKLFFPAKLAGGPVAMIGYHYHDSFHFLEQNELLNLVWKSLWGLRVVICLSEL